MVMKFSHMKTHWAPEQAMEVIEFLDQLRQTLWASYGEEIEEALSDSHPDQGNQPNVDPELNDDLNF